TRAPVPGEIHQHVLVDAAIIEEAVRVPLIRPDRFSRSGISREDGRRPLVVPGPLARVPRRRAGRAVVDEVQDRVVGDPTPDGSAADSPGLGRPARDPKILTAIGRVEGTKPG